MDTLQLKQLKILFLGDSCLDEYISGTCTRISPEAPVPILHHTKKEVVHGMAANALENFKNLSGIDPIFITNNRKDIRKIRFVDEKSKYQIMRYDIEKKLTPAKILDLPDKKMDVVVISDYDKGLVTEEIVNEIKRKYVDAKIFVDSKRRDVSIFSGCVLKLNESEHKTAQGLNKDIDLIVTLGPKGASWAGKIFPTKRVEVHDVCGAGDVFLASLVWKWLLTNDMKKSIIFANKCASYSVTKPGTYQLSREEYEKLENE